MTDRRHPLTLVTGFLGSGKTTLLRRLLREDGGQRTAVLINEFGEIGLDHLLVKSVTETAVVLQNGCICCTIRSDLQRALRELIDGRCRGDLPPFDRVLVETTGLADPLPIVQTIATDAMLSRQVRLANIIVTVDALCGAEQLDDHEVSRSQAGLADWIVLTKTDLATPEQARSLRARLSAMCPMARICDLRDEPSLGSTLLGCDPFDETARHNETRRWLRCLPAIDARDTSLLEGDVRTFSIRTEAAVDWTMFGVWLSALVYSHGADILRIKGLVNVPDASGPVVLNVVLRHVHPPFHLACWPDPDRASRLVFIVRRLDPDTVRRSLERVLSEQPAGGVCGRPRMRTDGGRGVLSQGATQGSSASQRDR